VATDYPECLAIVKEKVKPDREANKYSKTARERWWLYERWRPELYQTISTIERCFAGVLHTKYWSVAACGDGRVFSHALVVFGLPKFFYLGLLESFIHECWTREYSGSLETRLRYSPTDCFETFPFPTMHTNLEVLGNSYQHYRIKVMASRQEGLTQTYNRFHDASETNDEIQKLRNLHVEMDKAVAAAYGWSDLDLGHGFHETKQGTRFTISESARREVLQRLLKLNHERYADEVKQGLHDKKRGAGSVGRGEKKTGGRGRKAKPSSGGASLFGDDEDDADLVDDSSGDSAPDAERPSPRPSRADQRVQPPLTVESLPRAIPIDLIDTDAILAAFRQAARGRGWLDRDELLKHVSLVLGYLRLGPKIDESLRGHLRAAIRRRIIEADGPSLVRAGTGTMSDYGLDELRETFRSVMRKGTVYEREDVIHALARYLGFVRVTDTIRQPIKSAINSAIRHGLLGYNGSVIWREE